MANNDACVRECDRPIRLELLDGFRLQVGGVTVETLSSTQRLLALLALRGSAIRAVVAGTLWGDCPEGRALGNLRTTIWRINRTVPGLVLSRQAHLTLAGFVDVDVAELSRNAAIELYGKAGGGGGRMHTLQHGELLPGWYEDWVIFERERLRHIRLHALEAAARRLTAQGDYAAALEAALEAVRCEPLRESAHRAVIVVHLTEDNAVEALQAYEHFRNLLEEEVGLRPSRNLASLVFGHRKAATPHFA